MSVCSVHLSIHLFVDGAASLCFARARLRVFASEVCIPLILAFLSLPSRFAGLHHQPASFEHSSKVKAGKYSSHQAIFSFVSSSGSSAIKNRTNPNIIAKISIQPMNTELSLMNLSLRALFSMQVSHKHP